MEPPAFVPGRSRDSRLATRVTGARRAPRMTPGGNAWPKQFQGRQFRGTDVEGEVVREPVA